MGEELRAYYDRGTSAEHGEHARYSFGCHCDTCKYGERLYKEERRRNSGIKPKPIKGENIEHGNRTKYVYGCRCELCSKANRDYQRGWMKLNYHGVEYNDPWID